MPKSKLIEARLPRGFIDREAGEIAAMDAMIAKIRGVYERYGFDPVETPLFEYTEALGKFLPDTDRPNAGVFSLQDDDEQWMSLRYDLTAPLARHFAENFERLPKPYRSYRQGYVFRNEKPGPGRFRQFMQFDADTVGAPGPEADAEMCMMMADTMDALGLQGKYVVKVNNRKVLDGVLESAGVSDDGQKLAVLRAIDKMDKFGPEGVKLLLGDGRKDESGDFTKGAGLSGTQIELIESLWKSVAVEGVTFARVGSSGIMALDRLDDAGESQDMERAGPFEFFSNQRTLAAWEYAFSESPKSLEAISELRAMCGLFEASGYGTKRIRVDSSVVRGLEYYTGPVFEIELTFEVRNEQGYPVVFGSVGGGGRYDGLVSRFRSEPVPATGFSIGVSRLATALRLTGNLAAAEMPGPVVVLVMEKDRIAEYQKMTSELRREGIRAEMFLGATKNFGKQVAYADKRRAPVVIIQGSDERTAADGEHVTIKDMAEGATAALSISDHATWKAERPGQVSVPRSDLVRAVKSVLSAKDISAGGK